MIFLFMFSKKSFMPLIFAIRTIRTHKARTFLALLGVVIGVFSVVVVQSFGDGVKRFILGQVESFGTDVIQIEVKVPNTGKMSSENATGRAQGVQITTLKTSDRDAIVRLPNVEAAYAGTIGQERVTVGNIGKRVLLFGAGADAPLVDGGVNVTEGRFYTDEEDASLARVIVLGSGVKETFFGEGNAIGESVTLRGEKYRVVGVLEPRGTVAFFDFDALAYVPVKTLEKKILGVDYVQMISVKMADAAREDETIALVTALLRDRHDITDPSRDDFGVTSTREAQETLSDVFGTITILLLALTSISLVVGGVGIMNVMYVSVAERTSEIGLRKAIGATSGNILRQFLFEALIITGLGGTIGIVLGVLFSYALSYVISRFGYVIDLSFTAQSLLLGAVFSMAVGLVFGLSPASRAAKLTPMEALRKE
jgi:putative ABC transport system permease protein